MSDLRADWGPESRRGCLAAVVGVGGSGGGFALCVVDSGLASRGGEGTICGLHVEVSESKRPGHARVDVRMDVPRNAEPGFRRRLTDAVVRVAEVLRSPG